MVFSNGTTFLYSSSLKGCTIDAFPYVAGGSTGRLDVDRMLPLPLLGVGLQLCLH